jgi:F420-dependent oxidoreductase-like protein
MRVCLMIEGQEDVGWDEWVALARAAEDARLDALFRSDHYLSIGGGPERGSLDAWATIAALAATTRRLRLGTLVSPATFRHPSVLAKSVVTADHVSYGRVELGIGAGWYDAEHTAYGFPFPPMGARMDALAEQLEIIRRQWDDGPFDFDGAHYRVRGLDAQPKPVQRPGPPIIVGGLAGPRSVALATRWADEYNAVFTPAGGCAEIRTRLDAAAEAAGRSTPLPLSLMTGCVLGTDAADLRHRVEAIVAASGSGQTVEEWLAAIPEAWIVGTLDQAREQLDALEAAGVERVMLQHQNHRDLAMVHLLGTLV